MDEDIFFFSLATLCIFAGVLAHNAGIAGLTAGTICVLALIVAQAVLKLKSVPR